MEDGMMGNGLIPTFLCSPALRFRLHFLGEVGLYRESFLSRRILTTLDGRLQQFW